MVKMEKILKDCNFIKWSFQRLEQSSEKIIFENESQIEHTVCKYKEIAQKIEDASQSIFAHSHNDTEEGEKILSQLSLFLDEVETRILELKRIVLPKIKPEKEDKVVFTTPQEVQANLPKLNLPKFSGLSNDWANFLDLYNASVHNNAKLSNAVKFQYLKGCLSGIALDTVKALTISDSNYLIALETLQAKFERKREIYYNYIDKILNSSFPSKVSSDNINQFVTNIEETLKQIENLGLSTKNWDGLLIRMFMSKISNNLIQKWQFSLNRQEIPDLKHLFNFLSKYADSLVTNESSREISTKNIKVQSPSLKRKIFNIGKEQCVLCKHSHGLSTCPTFLKMSRKTRMEKLRSMQLCFLCLKGNHTFKDCKAAVCKHCKLRHHHLLHFTPSVPTVSSSVSTINPQSGSAATATVSQADRASNFLIRDKLNVSVPLKVISKTPQVEEVKSVFHAFRDVQVSCLGRVTILGLSPKGTLSKLNAFVDSGSEINIISLSTAKQLKLPLKPCKLSLEGLGKSALGKCLFSTIMHFTSPVNHDEEFSSLFYVIDDLDITIPAQCLDKEQFEYTSKLSLSDPKFFIPTQIQALLGADLFHRILLPERVIGPSGSNSAFNSKLGWIIFGSADPKVRSYSIKASIDPFDDIDSFSHVWDLEPVVLTKPPEISHAERSFTDHIQLIGNRFQVELPFKPILKPIGNSFSRALSIFKMQESRFGKDTAFQKAYFEYMDNSLKQGHIELVGDIQSHYDSKDVRQFYLPHLGVFKKENNSLRVVINGSSKSSSGYSLNDNLEIGDPLQNDLRNVLSSFRFHKHVATTDIVGMYMQIMIEPKDRDYLRIFWRNSPLDPIKIYRFTRVPFGLAPSAFLSIRVLHHLSDLHINDYPEVAPIIKNHTYLDDFLFGASSTEKLFDLIKNLTELLSKGSFVLDKWASNSPDLVDSLKEKGIITHSSKVTTFGDPTSVLGIKWDPSSDCFSFKFSLPDSKVLTKRTVLSELSKMFDPLGWIAPCTIRFKIIFQLLWKMNLSWDTLVPKHFQDLWSEFRETLPLISQVSIPRWILTPETDSFSLIVYSDASEAAYGSVVYIASFNKGNFVSSNLLSSKFRVTPLKSKSLPRLELSAVHTGSKLLRKLIPSFPTPLNKIYWFTDSTLVLNWVTNPPYVFKTFISNRVAEIQELDPKPVWSHIPGKDNPADIGSRGISISQLIDHPTWFSGVTEHFQNLHSISSYQPTDSFTHPDLEKKDLSKAKLVLNIHIKKLSNLLETSSDYSRLKLQFAILLKFIDYLKLKLKLSKDPSFELKGEFDACHLTSYSTQAETAMIRITQMTYFQKEISQLKSNQGLPKSNPLISLNPFVDSYGLLRVGGRLSRSDLSHNAKHPLILPRQSNFTQVLIRSTHQRLFHCGFQCLETHLSFKYFIPKGRKLMRKIIRSCLVCAKLTAQTKHPLMSDLPEDRVTYSPPFKKVGLDYFGPFNIHLKRARGSLPQKAYALVFVCFTTKATHFELCPDLSLESFMDAFRRFTSRRGFPSKIYSDNATTFVAASKCISNSFKTFLTVFSHKSFQDYLIQNNISWIFIPPYSPNFGGIWEAAVKSAKYHLKRVVGEQILSYTELETLLCQIEAILNSRPLTPLSQDLGSLEALTPAHFLTGSPLTSLPDLFHPEVPLPNSKQVEEIPLTDNKYFKLRNQMLAAFWTRWSSEYLKTLQHRRKWKSGNTTFEVGQLVLMKERNFYPTKWVLGRILELKSGQDSIVRVVRVKTAKGEFLRSVTTVSPLFLDGDC